MCYLQITIIIIIIIIIIYYYYLLLFCYSVLTKFQRETWERDELQRNHV